MDKKFYLDTAEITTKSTNKTRKGLKIAGYANTVAKDRSNDVIVASAWAKGIENFRRNPVLLYQHDHTKPIGKVDNIKVDRKGLHVEATVSDAAEDLHKVQTLINDGALKSFSVGFKVNDANYDRDTETFNITDVELLEISVVSVPCNQDSLFSVRKSFEEDSEGYLAFKSQFIADSEKEKEMTDGTSHEEAEVILSEEEAEEKEVNEEEITSGEVEAEEKEEAGEVDAEVSGEIKAVESEEKDEEDFEEVDPYTPIPFVNLLSAETAELEKGQYVKHNGSRFKITSFATDQNPVYEFLAVDLNGKSLDNTIEVKANEVAVVNFWDVDKDYDVILTSVDNKQLNDSDRENIKKAYETTLNITEQELFEFKSQVDKELPYEQERLNKLINLKTTPFGEWTDTNYQVAAHFVKMVEEIKNSPEMENKEIYLKLHGYINKETEKMAEQQAGDALDLTQVKGAEQETSAPIQVSEPEVAKLVEKTGEAIIKEADVQDSERASQIEKDAASDKVAELQAQVKKYEDQVAALQASKMAYAQSQRTEKQFTDREMSNAVLLAKALNKHDIFDTKMGQEIRKAVTSVDVLLRNFSTDIYSEMEQQLVVVPMFQRIAVDAKTFTIPVADEDTDGDVAQFASGTYNTGVADTTRVPTTNQHTIGSIDLTPHKFMAHTHLAKDEQEDTIIPLMDFLRQATTRRLARAMDKAVLRGTGALSGFTASPTNAITAGTGYASVMKGVTTLVGDVGASLTVDTAGSSTKPTPANIASARAALGKYGLQLGNQLVYLTTIEGYNELVQTSDFRTVDTFGPNATYLTGSVGAVYGIPIVITEFLDNVGSSNNDLGVLIYKPGFVIGERRGIEIESEYLPRQQVTAMYLSTRFDFKALTTNASAALDATKYSYAAVVEAG